MIFAEIDIQISLILNYRNKRLTWKIEIMK